MDPFEGNDEQPPSLHCYLYAFAEPVTNVDPSGRNPLSLVESAVSTLINTGLRSINSIKGVVVKRQVVSKLASEIGEEIVAEGVYFLLFEYSGGIKAYVGQSKDILRRIDEWERFLKRAGEVAVDKGLRVVGYIEVFTKDPAGARTKKFIRELIEQGFKNILEADPRIQLLNKNNPVNADAAIDRFERHFRTPAMKGISKSFSRRFSLYEGNLYS
jgi:hypothetical protein